MTAPVPRAPIEAKAQAAGGAAFAAGIAIWALQTYVFQGNAVPAGLVSLIYAVVPAALALGAAYLAPHTPRPLPLAAAAQAGAVKVIPPSMGRAPDPPPPAPGT